MVEVVAVGFGSGGSDEEVLALGTSSRSGLIVFTWISPSWFVTRIAVRWMCFGDCRLTVYDTTWVAGSTTPSAFLLVGGAEMLLADDRGRHVLELVDQGHPGGRRGSPASPG